MIGEYRRLIRSRPQNPLQIDLHDTRNGVRLPSLSNPRTSPLVDQAALYSSLPPAFITPSDPPPPHPPPRRPCRPSRPPDATCARRRTVVFGARIKCASLHPILVITPSDYQPYSREVKFLFRTGPSANKDHRPFFF